MSQPEPRNHAPEKMPINKPNQPIQNPPPAPKRHAHTTSNQQDRARQNQRQHGPEQHRNSRKEEHAREEDQQGGPAADELADNKRRGDGAVKYRFVNFSLSGRRKNPRNQTLNPVLEAVDEAGKEREQPVFEGGPERREGDVWGGLVVVFLVVGGILAWHGGVGDIFGGGVELFRGLVDCS